MIAWMLLAVTAAQLGCDRSGEPAAPFPVQRRWSDGPVQIVAELSHERMTVADRLEVQLKVIAPTTVAIQWPPAVCGPVDRASPETDGRRPSAALPPAGQLTLVDATDLPAQLLPDGNTAHLRRYVFEPFLPGPCKVPAFELAWSREESSPPHLLRSEPIAIDVVALVAADGQAAKLQDIAPLAQLPPRRWWWAAVPLLLLVLAAGLIVYRRRGHASEVVPSPAAHLIALRQLEQLLADRLVEQGLVEPFYVRLSDILRGYLVRRFELPATMQTSQESLDCLACRSLLEPAQQSGLQTLLAECDLVKFAAVRPERMAMEAAVDRCRRFIEATADGQPAGGSDGRPTGGSRP